MVNPWDGPLPRAVLTPPNCNLAQRMLGQPPATSSSSLPDSSADGTSASQADPAAAPFGNLRATPTSPPPAEDYLYEPQTAEDLLPEEDYQTAYGSEDMEEPAEDGDPSPGSPSMDAQAGRRANTDTEHASLVAHVSFLEHKLLQLEADRAAAQAKMAADRATVGKSAVAAAPIFSRPPRKQYRVPDPSPAAGYMHAGSSYMHAAPQPADQGLGKLLNKPPTYNGTPSSDLRLWLTIMCHYLPAQAVQYPQAVALAVSFLVGDAAKYWHTHSDKLRKAGKDIFAWRVFKTALFERFGYKNAENAARDRLSALHQGNMTFAQYVNAFDDCYAYIPEYDEADKVHRFLHGLRYNIRQKLCVNPVTARRWTRYLAMVAYGHNLMNESAAAGAPSADAAVDLLAGNKRSQSQTRQQQPDKRTRGSDPTRGRPSASQPPSTHSRDTIPARQVEGGDKEFTIVKEGQANSTFRRSKQIANFCMSRHICAHCYRSGHSPNHCRSGKAQGYPQGFDPHYVPPNRQ